MRPLGQQAGSAGPRALGREVLGLGRLGSRQAVLALGAWECSPLVGRGVGGDLRLGPCGALLVLNPSLLVLSVPPDVLVIPERPVARFADLTADEVTDLFGSVQAVGRVVESVYAGTALSIVLQVPCLARGPAPRRY